MSQTPEPTPSRPPLPADLPWGIHYLREDIQDLRQELRHEVGQLRGEMKELRGDLSAQVNGLRSDLSAQVNGLRSEVGAQINGLRSEMKDLRGEASTHFKWTIGTLITLTGLIVVVFKL